MHSGEYSTLEVAELFGVGRSSVYRAIRRQRLAAKTELAGASTPRRLDAPLISPVVGVPLSTPSRDVTDEPIARRIHTLGG